MSVQSWLRSLKARHGYRTASISRAPAGRTAFCPCLEALGATRSLSHFWLRPSDRERQLVYLGRGYCR